MPSRPPPAPRLLGQRLVALVLAFAALWLLPPLMPWLHGPPLAGWPRWAWALGGGWVVLIAGVALLLERGRGDEP